MATVEHRDRTGRRLIDYPRPSVAVDTALLTIEPGVGGLAVLEVRREHVRGWGLPGTFLHEGERLIDAVLRSLWIKAGVQGVRPKQLRVFDDPDRDDRGWVLSVAHVDVVSPDRLAGRHRDNTRLVPIDQPGRLPYGHADIIRAAVADLRARYASEPDPGRLLAEPFTLRDLQRVHEVIAGAALQRDTFRRAMQPHLIGTGETSIGTRGRPAELFRRGRVATTESRTSA